jgi:hypothetical protein
MSKESHKPTRPPEETIRRGYETGNPSVRGMVIFTIGFVVSMGVCLVAIWGLYLLLWGVRPRHPRSPLLGEREPVPSEPLKQEPALMTPRPRLQPSGSLGQEPVANTPPMDFKAYHADQAAMLNGWSVDLWSGSVTMPIEQAMALAADRLPTAPRALKHLPRPNYSGGFEP